MVKIGDYVKIISSNDSELAKWIKENKETPHKVVYVDSDMFWIENCDCAIWSGVDVYEKEVKNV